MFVVSHRGNLQGPDAENRPEAIRQRLEEGFCVEVDLHWDGENAFLGHDAPCYQIRLSEWDREGVFFHLKTPFLPELEFADAFAIDQDPYALTLRGYVWTNYGIEGNEKSIICAPELVGAGQALETYIVNHPSAAGICTDFPLEARKIISKLMG